MNHTRKERNRNQMEMESKEEKMAIANSFARANWRRLECRYQSSTSTFTRTNECDDGEKP